MKRIIAICIAAVGMISSLSASAQVIERIYAKDGSVYNGYIKTQEPGKRILVDIESAMVYVNAKNITQANVKEYNITEVSEPIRQWVNENRPSAQTIELVDITLNNGFQFRKAVQLEKGVRLKLFITDVLSVAKDKKLKPVSSFEFQWDQVEKTEKVVDSQSKIGTFEVVTMKNGESVSGFVTEQIIGYEMRILELNNEIRSISFDDIKSIETKVISSEASLWAQLVMLDEITLNNSDKLCGFINKRDLGKSVSLFTTDGYEKVIAIENIAQYNKVTNKEYYLYKNTDSATDNAAENDEKQENVANEESKSVAKDTTQQTSNFDYAINGVQATLNTIIYGNKETCVLSQPVVDVVKIGETVRIEVPSNEISQFELKIVRTVERHVDKLMVSTAMNTPYLYSWNKKDLNADEAIGFGLTFSNGKNILTFKCDQPGVYVVLPMVKNNKCIAFKVTNK